MGNPKKSVLRLLALDYAGLGNQVTGIEREISQMYAKAGIEVRWRTAHYKRGKHGYELVGMNAGGSPDATIRFMPDTTGLKMTDDGAGTSVPGSNIANVVMSRVSQLAHGTDDRPLNPDVVAALAGVHEIGHALFSFEHTPKTIMRQNFSPDEIGRIRTADPWNAQQIAAIQKRVAQLEGAREPQGAVPKQPQPALTIPQAPATLNVPKPAAPTVAAPHIPSNTPQTALGAARPKL